MGCKESKLAVGSAEPAKRTKSASSRSTSTRVERLDSTTSVGVATTVDLENEKAPLDATSKDVAKGGGLIKKAVGCQTTDHCPRESDHAPVPAKATAEEEETKCKEEMKLEEEEALNANDQVQTTKEDTEEGKPNEAKVEAEAVENQGQQVIEPIEVETDPAIEEETDKTVSNNEDDQPQATEQEEEEAAHKVETIVVAEAPSVSEEEVAPTEEESGKINADL